MAMAGGKDDMRYRLSIGSLNQNGIILGTNSRRASMGLTYSDLLLDDRLEFRANLKGSKADDNYPAGGIGAATAMAPTQPLRNADGTYFQWADWLGAEQPAGGLRHGQQSRDRLPQHREPRRQVQAAVARRADARRSARAMTSRSPRACRSRRATRSSTSRAGAAAGSTRTTPSQTNTVLELFGTYTRKLSDVGSTLRPDGRLHVRGLARRLPVVLRRETVDQPARRQRRAGRRRCSSRTCTTSTKAS